MIPACAAHKPKGRLNLINHDPGAFASGQVEIDATTCGVCRPGLSTVNNEWGDVTDPLVPGHEVIGKVLRRGVNVKCLKAGSLVWFGWFSSRCMVCRQCMSGNHNLCPGTEQTPDRPAWRLCRQGALPR